MHIGGVILLWSLVLYEILYSVSFADSDSKCCEIWGSHSSDWRLLSFWMWHLLRIVTNISNTFHHKIRISRAWEKVAGGGKDRARGRSKTYLCSPLFSPHTAYCFDLKMKANVLQKHQLTIYQATHRHIAEDVNVRSRKVLSDVYVRTLSLLLWSTLDYLHVDLTGLLLEPSGFFKLVI